MQNIAIIIHIIISALLIAFVLLQMQGSQGLGSVFGGKESFYHSKRGVERVVFIATIFISFLFLISSIGNFSNFK